MEKIEENLSMVKSNSDKNDQIDTHWLSGDNLVFTLVPIGTMIVLCILKVSVFTILRRIFKEHTVTCQESLVSQDQAPESILEAENQQSCRCRKYDRLPWYYSDLCCDVIICPSLLVMGFYLLHTSTVTLTPFSGKETFDSVKITLALALGNQFYRFVRLSIGPHWEFRCKLAHMHVIIAIVTYITIIVTQQDSIVGVVGVVTQMTTLMHTLRCIVVHRNNQIRMDAPPSMYAVNMLRVMSGVVCSLMLPILYLSFAVTTQAPLTMSYYSLAVFSFTISFFAVVNITDVISSVTAGCRDIGIPANPERTGLLAPYRGTTPHRGTTPPWGTTTHMGTTPQNGTTPHWGTTPQNGTTPHWGTTPHLDTTVPAIPHPDMLPQHGLTPHWDMTMPQQIKSIPQWVQTKEKNIYSTNIPIHISDNVTVSDEKHEQDKEKLKTIHIVMN